MEGRKAGKLLILDDLFPHPRAVESWRGTEFHAYLDVFFDATIYTTMSSIGMVGQLNKEDILKYYLSQYPQYSKQFIYHEEAKNMFIKDTDLAYCIFLNNIWNNLDVLEKYNVPFVFELYPGGGFAFYNDSSDKKLKLIMRSRCFKGVIVSNTIIADYLLKCDFCKKEQMLIIEGCVLNNQNWEKHNALKKYYSFNKDTFDIVFTAYRYSKYGIDKGYDTYVEVAKRLHKISDKFQFHVIGNFDNTVLDVHELGQSIHFYGIKEINWFNEFYQNMDVLISANRVSILSSGAFDGFPTGCGVDAIMRKVVLIATDELEQNNKQYINGKDIFIVDADPQVILDRIYFLYKYPYMLKYISENGYRRGLNLYSFEKQIKPRINYIDSFLPHF